ncbi:MAG: hypothetical protein ACR2P6_04520 [Gammaproteobacteria bacterium]
MPPVSAEYRDSLNMLVISVAGDFQSRTLFERQFVAAMADRQGKATAYHTVIGRRPYLTRTALDTAILARGFDVVLLVREKGQEREELAPGRPVGRAFDLFGYDYAELNSGDSIEQSAAITFIAELYSVAERKKIWSIESLSFDKTSATDLISEQTDTISQQITKDRLLHP